MTVAPESFENTFFVKLMNDLFISPKGVKSKKKHCSTDRNHPGYAF